MAPLLPRVGAAAGALAYLASAAFQLYRSRQGTGLEVDRFTAVHAVGYVVLLALSLALLTDRAWAWWVNGTISAVVFLQAPFVYYPRVYDARPLGTGDWLEGTWFTALLFLVSVCAVLRLAQRPRA